MVAHIFAEEGYVWEIEVVGDLLDAFLRVFQLIANIGQHRLVDQFEGTASTAFPANGGEVFRGDAELIGIPSDRPRLHLHGGELLHERLEQEIFPPISALGLCLVSGFEIG